MKFEGMTLYVIYGWRVEGQILEKCILDLSPEVIALGMGLIFPKDDKAGFFGELLTKVEGEASVIGIIPPPASSAERMASVLKKMGLDKEAMEAPLIWVVLG